MMEWCHTNWISALSLYSSCIFPSKRFSVREITLSTSRIELLPSSGNETFQTRSFHITSCQRDEFHQLKGIIFFHLQNLKQYKFIQKLPRNMEKAKRKILFVVLWGIFFACSNINNGWQVSSKPFLSPSDTSFQL